MANKAIGYLTFNFGADMRGFNRAMKKAQRSVKRFGKSMKNIGSSMTTNLTMPIVGLGAVAVKTFADFEQAMLKVKAVSGATGEEFKSLTDNAKRLGSSTMFTASQVAELQLELSKLGLTPEEINKSTDSILSLAQATGHELAASAEIVASTMNSFGLEAEQATKVADMFAVASSSAAIDMEKLSVAMPTVGATASAVGVPLDQLTSMMMTLADSGMVASKMGTNLRRIFVELATKGISLEDAMNQINTSTDKVSTATKLFGKNAFGAALILADNTQKTADYNRQLDNAAGKAKEMADVMDSGAAGAMRRLRSQAEGVAIDLGEMLIPVFQKLMNFIQNSLSTWSGLDERTKKIIVSIGLFVAGLGPAISLLGNLAIAFSALISPTTAVIGLFAVLGTSLTWIYNNIDSLTTLIANTFESKFGASFFTALGASMKSMGIIGGDAMMQLGTKMALVVATGEDLPEPEFKSFIDIVKEASGALANFTGVGTGGTKDLSTETGGMKKLPRFSKKFDLGGIARAGADELDVLNKKIKTTSLEIQDLGTEIGQNFEGALFTAMTAQEDFFESFMSNIKKAIGQMIAMHTAQLITNSLFGSLTGGLTTAGGGGLLGKIFGFADGGIVSGPTVGLMGEYPGAGSGNPEVIAPLNKLKGMMGSGVQNVQVEGRISGNDIWLSNSKTNSQRNRAI